MMIERSSVTTIATTIQEETAMIIAIAIEIEVTVTPMTMIVTTMIWETTVPTFGAGARSPLASW
jgi:hypothetical protein